MQGRRIVTLAVATAVGLVAPFALTDRAGAVCAGPTIEVQPGTGEAGTAVTISGDHWGDNCFDVGPLPPGMGPLGNPQQDIEVVFTDAAGTATVVATADADADYRFSTAATIPADAVAGLAGLDAESVTGFDVRPAPFEVTTEPSVIPATPGFTG